MYENNCPAHLGLPATAFQFVPRVAEADESHSESYEAADEREEDDDGGHPDILVIETEAPRNLATERENDIDVNSQRQKGRAVVEICVPVEPPTNGGDSVAQPQQMVGEYRYPHVAEPWRRVEPQGVGVGDLISRIPVPTCKIG